MENIKMFDFLKSKKNYWEEDHEELKEIEKNKSNESFLKDTLKNDSDIHRRTYSLFYLLKLRTDNDQSLLIKITTILMN